MGEQMDAVLDECIASLNPYLDQLVIAGGWVPYIYGKVYDGAVFHDPLFTSDFDTAIPSRGFAESELTLDNAILDAGFEHEFASLDNPPVVKYVKKLSGDEKIEIEFITDEPGNREGVKTIGSVNAQALRYVGLLLDSPWKLSLHDLGFPRDGFMRVPRPAAYVLHKALVAPRRRQRAKTAKDLYYLFYVLDTFPLWKEETLGQIEDSAQGHPKMATRAHGYLSTMFANIDSDGVDLLVSQRPQTAYPHMSEDQFRQYARYRVMELVRALVR